MSLFGKLLDDLCATVQLGMRNTHFWAFRRLGKQKGCQPRSRATGLGDLSPVGVEAERKQSRLCIRSPGMVLAIPQISTGTGCKAPAQE